MNVCLFRVVFWISLAKYLHVGSHDTIYKRKKERGRENKTASCVPGLGAPARLVEGTPFLMRRRSGDVDTLGGRDSLQRWHVAETPVPRKGRGWAGGRDEDPPSGSRSSAGFCGVTCVGGFPLCGAREVRLCMHSLPSRGRVLILGRSMALHHHHHHHVTGM